VVTKIVLVNSMDVGQGLGTFVQLFDEDLPTALPTHTLLVDFGCLGDSEAAGNPRVEWVRDELNKMPQPTIDALYISHGDGDHYNLLPKLLTNFKPYDPQNHQTGKGTLQIKYCRYAGETGDFRSGKTNVLAKINTYMAQNTDPADRQSSLAGAPGGTSFNLFDTSMDRIVNDCVHTYVVTENVSSTAVQMTADASYVKNSYGNNTRSMVLLLTFLNGQYEFISTGDATARTLLECTRVFDDRMLPGEFFENTVGITIPHHGSSTTLFAMQPRETMESAEASVEKFLKAVKPKVALASAAARSKFHHPRGQVLSMFWKYLRADTEPNWNQKDLKYKHYFTGFFVRGSFQLNTPSTANPGQFSHTPWPKTVDGYSSIKTALPLFTNIYYNEGYNTNQHTVLPPTPGVTEVIDPFPLSMMVPAATWVMKLSADKVSMAPIVSRAGVWEEWLPDQATVPAGVAVRAPARRGGPVSMSPSRPPGPRPRSATGAPLGRPGAPVRTGSRAGAGAGRLTGIAVIL
jgi:hypothetical protein